MIQSPRLCRRLSAAEQIQHHTEEGHKYTRLAHSMRLSVAADARLVATNGNGVSCYEDDD
jgi:hypothetical protein